MPSITIEFTTEKGQAALTALDAQGYTDTSITNPLQRLKFGVIKMIRKAEKQHRQAIAQIEASQVLDLVNDITEDEDLAS